MPRKKVKRRLASREQQILDVLYQFGEASVAEVRAKLTDPPSYSSVRTMLNHLEKKGVVRRDKAGVTHRYAPVQSHTLASRSALRAVIETFFPSSPGDALAALLDDSASKLSPADLDRLAAAIDRARGEGR